MTILEILRSDDLANEVAVDCHDSHHDIRWCPTCVARQDGIDEYRERVLALAKESEPAPPPLDARALFGTWPGELDDGFEAAVDAARKGEQP